jgi:hypothetical protein
LVARFCFLDDILSREVSGVADRGVHMKLKVYKKKKCLLATPYEETTYNDPHLHNMRAMYVPVELDSIESYFVEKVNNGFILVVETGVSYKELYIAGHFSSRQEAESAAKLIL